jgi:HSP20 family protein
MELMKWNPAKDMFDIRSRFDTLFDSFFPTRTAGSEGENLWNWNPAVDVYDNEDTLVIKAELPGVEKDQIHIDVQGSVLTLKGERTLENEVKEEHYYRRERSYGRFQRSFMLPVKTDPDSVKAEFKDGVLNIRVPKPEQHKPKKITVQ